MICKICGKPLKQAQWKNNNTLKSCPHCSLENGEQHVYYAYPDRFGETPKRATPKHPEGPQSHCTECRPKHPAPSPHEGAIYCEELK
ncbi:hypothetical protein L9G74_03360 [Shewanella sp. C32]|uniref:Uncharacterized protein n=1 Tax=Shewanella electrica TaxID=515560 RepID=A0ABT2FJT2_9GAMM|nr:hypothetical protein [Shewanella electrica]MCH1923369.1 hypothetical protein [Shewanella electrica]MCS4555466.1 hypothetical protein [Shewanella electrica]